jgi:hypothetical protein
MASRETDTPPIAIGGIGGSGTRLIARLLHEVGFDIGRDLNDAWDNLTFTLLFKWPGVDQASDELIADLWALFTRPATVMRTRSPQSRYSTWRDLFDAFVYDDGVEFGEDWRAERIDLLHQAASGDDSTSRCWGWKEPNTHLVIDRLLNLCGDLRYLHVMRNGLDMAFSDNQMQLRLWGEAFLGRPVADTPADSLAYWVAAHRRIERIAANHPGRVKLLNYDALCQDPDRHLPDLLAFAGVDPDWATLDRLTPLIAPPESIGRHRARDTSGFDPDDVAYVRQLGFEVGV